MKIKYYGIIKRSKLKVTFNKSWWKHVNEIPGGKWLRKNRSFYLT
jgi:hypothetical protein